MDKLPPDAIAALTQGRLIEAIRIVRDRTGLDLQSAKEAVERYANPTTGASGWQESNWGRGEPEPAGRHDADRFGAPPAALTALAMGNKVEAVRLTRAATGLGLAEAKRLVESLATGEGDVFGPTSAPTRALPSISTDPMAEPGRVRSNGIWPWVLAALLLVALAAAHFGAKP